MSCPKAVKSLYSDLGEHCRGPMSFQCALAWLPPGSGSSRRLQKEGRELPTAERWAQLGFPLEQGPEFVQIPCPLRTFSAFRLLTLQQPGKEAEVNRAGNRDTTLLCAARASLPNTHSVSKPLDWRFLRTIFAGWLWLNIPKLCLLSGNEFTQVSRFFRGPCNDVKLLMLHK
jgi:hypothetical protein